MDISWCLLTYNRKEQFIQSFKHNSKNAGYPWKEIIWCDNASTDGVREWALDNITPTVAILNEKNVGADPGYNRVMCLARGEYVVITGSDTLMPDNWLKTFVEHFEAIPNSAIATMFIEPIEKTLERKRGEYQTINEKKIIPCLPIGRKFFRRSLLKDIGYMREDMGLYGWVDICWSETAVRVCNEKSLLCYNIPDQKVEHLGTEGSVGFDHKDQHEYWKWKQEQVKDPKKKEKMDWCRKNNWPYYSPF